MSSSFPAPAAYDQPAGIAPTATWAQAVNDWTDGLYVAWHDAWQSWTPTYSNITVGNGTVTARFFKADGVVLVNYKLVFGSTSSVGASPQLTGIPTALGLNGSITDPQMPQLAGYYDSSATKWYHGVAHFGGTNIDLGYDNGAVSSTVPFTWATGDILSVSGQLPDTSEGGATLR